MANKPKTTQPQTPDKLQGRDSFQTPNYAVDLLVPFIPWNMSYIWECASGEGKIADRLLLKHGYPVYRSDIRIPEKNNIINFISDIMPNPSMTCIITNPPFSLKYKFIHEAIRYNLPFAFLIPFDMCKKMADLFDVYGCQGIVPKARINYITPTGKSESTGHTSYYHSFWITRYFNLNNQLVFVDLTKEMRENI